LNRLAQFSLLSSAVLAALVVGALHGEVSALPAGGVGTFTGTYEVITADTIAAPGQPSEDVVREYLVVGSRVYRVHKPKATYLRGHSTVTVRGTLQGNELTVSNVTSVSPVPLAATTGTTRVLVILAYWTAPDSTTQSSAAQQMFTDTNNWYRENSYGTLGQSGDVTPWVRISAPVNNACYADYSNIMTNAQSAALGAGYDSAAYDRTVVYFPYDNAPGSDCAGFSGWAEEPGSRVWLNGYMDRRVTTHEQGHNYGLSHAHSLTCSTGVLTGTCSFVEYGDDYDAMGSSWYAAHFSAKQKNQLGWLAATTLTPGTSTLLAPLEGTTGTRAAVVNISATRSYWVEYRQPTGVDAGLPVGATNGVLIHLVDPTVSPNDPSGSIGPSLLDESFGDNTIADATLKAGQSWTSPEGFIFSVGSMAPSGAQVSLASTVAGKPDLVVTSLTWSPTSPVAGNAITFTAVVQNQGTAATPSGVKHGVAFLVDGAEVSWSDNDFASLAAGASITLTANGGPSGTSTWNATSGSHTAQAQVDDSRLITESNESNNTLSQPLTVSASTSLPDLVVTSVAWTPTSPAPGNAVLFKATIKNQGTAATPSGVIHGVGFLVDGTNVAYTDTDTASLAAGASITLTATGSNAGPSTWPAVRGRHTVKAWVDDQNRITESNESNNTLTAPLDVYAPVAPSSVAISAGTLRSGTVTALANADGTYYQVNSTTATTRTATWAATVANVPNSTPGLQLTYKGANSVSCTQTIYLFNYTTNAWVTVKTATVGTSAVTTTVIPSGTMADYVSGTSGSGSVKVQVTSTSTSASFYASGDQVTIGYL
jgi:M6 family metalloprotease-like protein